jgi:hypothetical protein
MSEFSTRGDPVRHTLTLYGFLPTPLNRLMRIHPAGRHPILAADAQLIAVLAAQQGVPEALARLLVDDSPSQLTLGTVESVRGPARRTRMVLEDLSARGRPGSAGGG